MLDLLFFNKIQNKYYESKKRAVLKIKESKINSKSVGL